MTTENKDKAKRQKADSYNSALDAFDAALREMQKPSKAVIAEAVRELFQVAKYDATEAKAVAEQRQAELSDAFHAFLTLHEDTAAFAKLKADKGRLLHLASRSGGDHE